MAFPETGILDDFDRANGSPGANWTPNIWQGFSDLAISSNTLARSASNFESDYWNAQTFGPDCEVYCDIVTPSSDGTLCLVARLSNPNDNAQVDFYELAGDSGNSYVLKTVDGSRTQIGANIGVVFSAGDSAGLSVIGSTLTAYRKPSGGSWGQVWQDTDSSITGAGYIGLIVLNSSAGAFDNFGGGTISSVTRTIALVL